MEKKGDWKCTKCGTNNFAKKFACFKCGQGKGGANLGSQVQHLVFHTLVLSACLLCGHI